MAQARIIVFALMAGIAIFSVVAVVVGPQMQGGGGPDDTEPADPILPDEAVYVGIGLTIVAAFAGMFLRKFLASKVGQRREEALAEIKEGKMPSELMTATITGCAVVESVGLLGAVGTLLTSNVMYLAMPAVAIAVMLTFVPTESSMENLAHE